MSMSELREACGLLFRMPLLWIPGIVAGLFAAVLWLILMSYGAFFAGRLVIIFGLVLLFFITGMFVLIKNNGGDLRSMIETGRQYYFRSLLPLLVVLFIILLVFVLVVLTLTLLGMTPDSSLVVLLSFGVMIPSFLLTFFADTAAVFEEKKVFGSIQKSIELVSVNISHAILFFAICAVVCSGILFCLMVLWEILLYTKIEPLTRYTEEQLMTFTPDQLLSLIGTDGIWVTAAVLFIAGLVLVPLLLSYKACFYRKIAGGTIVIHQLAGEYDSKGRWYKY